jgi:hypothetical protein
MSRTIRLALADVHEEDTLRTIDDEGRWPSDVERREPETVIDAVALDHRAVRVDEDRERQAVGAVIVGHLVGALADDHQKLGSKGAIGRQIGLQLLQLPAAVRSPGAADEHDHRRHGAQHVRQPDFLSVVGA